MFGKGTSDLTPRTTRWLEYASSGNWVGGPDAERFVLVLVLVNRLTPCCFAGSSLMSGSRGGLKETDLRAHLASIVESSVDAIFSTDLDGIVLSWNAGARALFGHDGKEAMGQPIARLVGGPFGDLPAILDRLRGPGRADFPGALLRAEGDHPVTVSLTISPIRDEIGDMSAISVVGRAVDGAASPQTGAEAELRVHKRVQEIAGRLIPTGEVRALYRDLIEAAIDITAGDRGTLQALDPATGELVLLEAVALSPDMQESFARVVPTTRTSCGAAILEGRRAIVDYGDARTARTPEARVHLEAGIRAAQSTPLIARSGDMLGVLTTHWHDAQRLSEQQKSSLDILARQAADLLERAQAGNALRASERRERLRSEQLETLLDEAPMGVYLVDADFRIRQVNPPAEAVFEGIPDLIGRDFAQVLRTFWGAERGAEVERIFRHTLETGEPHHFPEFAEFRQDLGVTEFYDWRVARITLPEGRPGVVCYFRDISDQVHARLAIAESEQRYRALFETMAEGFCILQVIFDEADNPVDYRYDEINPAFVEHTGMADALGRTIRELVPDIEPFWVEVYGRVALTGESMRLIDHAESMERWFDVEAFRIGKPEDRRVAVLFSDITEQRAAEAHRDALVAEMDRQGRLYDAIVSGTPDLIYVFDLDYRFKFVNAALLEMWGRTREESIGKGLRELGYEEWHAEMHEREIDDVVATKKPIRGEVSFPHATLGERIYDYIFVPVFDESGQVDSVAGTTRDITERKRAERALGESEERLRLAKAAAQLGIHDYDVVSGAVAWDHRTREIWGVDPEESITYEIWLEGIHPDDRALAEEALRQALDPDERADYAAEYRVIHRRTGEIRWAQVTGQPTFIGEDPIRLVGTVKDITERKLTDEALTEANRRKDEFLATLSHELRNPLAAIRTGVAVLRNSRNVPARVRRVTGIIDRKSAHLVRLIDDLLDVSRISRGIVQLERTPTDLSVLIDEAAADLAAEIGQQELDLLVSTPSDAVWAHVDPVRIEQVVQNLLHNARKFTPRGGTIRVAVEREDGEAVIRVADTGIGIRSGDLTRVFDMFTQMSGSQNEQSQGLGIGLALARSIVELHDGSIVATSEGAGRGAELIVRLPLAQDALSEESRRGESGPEEPRQQLRILAAEDNEDVLDTLALVLRMDGHEVETAVNGGEALEKLRSYRPDVALLDIGMPVMSGYQVAREVRRESWGEGIRLIAMTGWGRDEDKKKAVEAGFDTHLTKPVEVEVLKSALESGSEPPSVPSGRRARVP